MGASRYSGTSVCPSLFGEQTDFTTIAPHLEGQERLVVDFRGTYEFTLDDRGRVSIPARYRHEFADKVILAMGQDGCIEVYTENAFSEMSLHVAAEPPTSPEGRRSRREFYAQSFDTELDRQGRILIPARFRERAGVNGAVVIAGRKECLEIWNPERLEAFLQDTTSSTEQGPRG